MKISQEVLRTKPTKISFQEIDNNVHLLDRGGYEVDKSKKFIIKDAKSKESNKISGAIDGLVKYGRYRFTNKSRLKTSNVNKRIAR